ncbi:MULTISPECIES: acyl-CoA dehydrogenase [Nocardia]|uniref:acyl-CoA dehydrogenase n=1 Tax=Nocardia TaxID=1817 RepID=UPI000D69070D|nr:MULTISPECIES: acyl-CoA dehydrogenase [Nocardia]
MTPIVAAADTEEQQSLAEALTQLLERDWNEGRAHKAVAEPHTVSERPLWSEMAALGVAGLPIPQLQGGSGGRWSDLAVALEICGAAIAPTPAVAAAGAIGALGILDTDTAARPLADIAVGDTVITVAWTPHDKMWGAPGGFLATGDSGTVSVTGSAALVLSPEADTALVLAEHSSGPVLVAVPLSGRGARMRRAAGLDLLRPLGELRLDRVDGIVLARGDVALRAIRRSLVTASTALSAELVGLAAHCLQGAVAHARQREQFGRVIGSFQAIKHKLADMLAGVELARTTTRNVAELLDSTASDDALDDAAALALLESIAVAKQVSADYIQILGGVGYTWEHEAHLYYRRAGAAAPLFGGLGTHRDRLDPTTHPAQQHDSTDTTWQEGSAAAELTARVRDLQPTYKEKWGEDDSFEARLDWQRRLHEAGWIAPQWPAEFGGRGLDIIDQVACDRVLAQLRTPMLAGILGVNNVAPTLMRYGTPQQQRHLRAIQSGAEIWCQGFSEPGAGSDLAGLRTKAVLDGDEFVITGQKIWTSEGMEATHCLLLVRTDPHAPPHKGISALLVPMDTPGITRRPITQITGEGGFAEVFFDGVRVPHDALLGPLHEGWKVTMTTLGFERAGVIVLAAGLEQSVHDVVAALAGRELDTGTRAALTDRLVEARALGLLGKRALGKIANGGAPGAEHSVIKLVWSLTMQAIGDTHLSALGLEGITKSKGIAAQRDYLSSRAATIAGGTTEVMRNILAERVLGLPK